jgi:hypothetical protein
MGAVAELKDFASWLYQEVLVPVGGHHSVLLSVTAPSSATWLYFMANRAET